MKETVPSCTGCYDLQLYCQAPSCTALLGESRALARFSGSSYADARRSAQERGWRVPRSQADLNDGSVRCPVHHRMELTKG